MRVLLTGAAGFIGSRLAERLIETGVEVVGVDRLSPYYDPRLKRRNVAALGDSRFELIETDLNDLDLVELLAGVDVVYHLAAQPGVRSSWGADFQTYVADNVLATQRLLEAAQEQPVERFVLASSSSVYGDVESFPTAESALPRPVSPYGVTKLAAESLCYAYWAGFGIPTVALRYFTIFGPRQRPDMAFSRFIAAALAGEPIEIYGDGHQSRDFTYVDDAVAATIAAASRGQPGAAYNVAGGTNSTIREVLETLRELIGDDIEVRYLDAVPGDARRTGADTSRAREELGFEPRVSLATGLARQLDSARAEVAGV